VLEPVQRRRTLEECITMTRTLVALVASLVLALSGVMAWSPAAFADAETSTGEKKPLDKIIFANGRTVECEILEETATQVTVMVHFGNLPPTKTTYQKAEILDIQRGTVDPSATASARATTRTAARAKDDKDSKRVAVDAADPDAALIYLVEFKGTFGSDISNTPLRDVFRDVDLVFNDMVEITTASGQKQMVVDPEKREKHIVVIKMDCGSDPRMGFDGLFRAEELGPIFEAQTQDKHRRIVFWIKEARDGAAFIPWLSQEIYFHPDGKMFFTSNLDEFSSGDKMVDAKLVSARLGHAHGFAIDGGYDTAPIIIDAMALKSRWLCYRLEGGEPVFLTREPTQDELREGWEILTDNGKGEYEDKNKVLFQNDQLILDARIAQVLGISDGTARELSDIAFALGVGRNYTEVVNRGQRIFDDWVKAKENAIAQVNMEDGTLWREFARINVDGDYDQRRRARGQQIKILGQIRSVFTRFAEVWDPAGSFRSRIDTQIEVIRQSQQADKASNNS